MPTSPQSIQEQQSHQSPAVISTGSSSWTNQILIPSLASSSSVYHCQDQPRSFSSQLVGRIHDATTQTTLIATKLKTQVKT
ncbi:hypothetical protein H4Q26_013526 [Puccinia striiformis f. sp. tritici PST-130]|nr:hypothetical protein H4Q26_013526 [Puccinia striiformis f. sp. tritici PST-130]